MDDYKPVLIQHDYSKLPVGLIKLADEVVDLLASGTRFEVGIGFISKEEEILTNEEEPMGTGRFITRIELMELSLIPISKEVSDV